MAGRCKWKPTGHVGIRPHSELENNPTLWGREDTIYEKEMQWFLQTEQSIKSLSLCVNMEIGQCSARVLWDTLIMNRKWERKSREYVFFPFALSDVCDNDTRTCFCRKWKQYALVCLMEIQWRLGHSGTVPSVQTTHWEWRFIHSTFRATHVFVAGQCEVFTCDVTGGASLFLCVERLDRRVQPEGHTGLCFCLLSSINNSKRQKNH